MLVEVFDDDKRISEEIIEPKQAKKCAGEKVDNSYVERLAEMDSILKIVRLHVKEFDDVCRLIGTIKVDKG